MEAAVPTGGTCASENIRRVAMPHDVFISYSSRDKLTADAVCFGLEAGGISCWIAPRDIIAGQEWGAAIVEAIHDCRLMVVVLSADSNTSKQVLREVERAVHQAIPVIPLRIENFELASALEYYLSAPHWFDAINGPLEEHIGRLVSNARTLLGRHPAESGAAGLPPPTTDPAGAPPRVGNPSADPVTLPGPAQATGPGRLLKSRVSRVVAGGVLAAVSAVVAMAVLTRSATPQETPSEPEVVSALNPAAPLARTPGGGAPVTLTDDFSDPAQGWLARSFTDPAGEFAGGYIEGEYAIRTLTPVAGKTWTVLGGSMYTNASVSVDARLVGAASGRLVGLVCRRQSRGNEYRLTVSIERRTFSIGRAVGGQTTLRVPLTQSPTILRTNQPNRIELRCIGDTIMAIINGTEVASFTDSTFAEGAMGISAGTQAGESARGLDARFDNLVLSRTGG